jgi:hypothetical protein
VVSCTKPRHPVLGVLILRSESEGEKSNEHEHQPHFVLVGAVMFFRHHSLRMENEMEMSWDGRKGRSAREYIMIACLEWVRGMGDVSFKEFR